MCVSIGLKSIINNLFSSLKSFVDNMMQGGGGGDGHMTLPFNDTLKH